MTAQSTTFTKEEMRSAQENPIAGILQRLPLLSHLSQSDIQEIVPFCQELNIPKHAQVYQKGTNSEHLYILLQGIVKVGAYGEDGREIIKDILSPLTVFGEMGLIGETQRQEYAIAMQADLKLLKIPVGEMKKLLKRHPEMQSRLLDWLGTRLRRVEDRLESMMSKDARERIIDFLKESAESHGKKVGFEMLIKHSLTQQDIANFTGTSRQTVTSVLNELRKSNLIYFNRKNILIRDMARLE
jgi:CRP/FNR family transcriptional regulator, cyclic AMP receptor protein